MPVPRLRMSPVRLPAKLLPGPTTVRLQSELLMLSPYFCVLGVWLSVAVLLDTTLSSQVIELLDEMRMPSRPEVTSALLVIVLPVMTLLFDFLLGWSAVVDDLTSWMPCKPVLVIVQPSTRLSLEARNSMPSPGTPSITQSCTSLLSDVQLAFLPSNTMPRPRDAVILTRSTTTSLPLSKSRASLVLRGVPLAETVRSLTVTLKAPVKLNGSVSAAVLLSFWMIVEFIPAPSKTMSWSSLNLKKSEPRSKVPAVNWTVPPPKPSRSTAAFCTTDLSVPVMVLPLDPTAW